MARWRCCLVEVELGGGDVGPSTGRLVPLDHSYVHIKRDASRER